MRRVRGPEDAACAYRTSMPWMPSMPGSSWTEGFHRPVRGDSNPSGVTYANDRRAGVTCHRCCDLCSAAAAQDIRHELHLQYAFAAGPALAAFPPRDPEEEEEEEEGEEGWAFLSPGDAPDARHAQPYVLVS